ncbi:MAG: hypothetical protein PHQ40_13220 [Anaerolineaceae bacterium]|nr:hypothetical protein [Anaerolineaceae bacterium]
MPEMMESEGTCACGGACGCGGDGQESLSRDEYITRLEQYLGDLKLEMQAVEDELSELRQTA